MRKMKTVFVIDRDINRAINEVNTGCEWVLNGEGVATIKHDGTSCLVRNGRLFKRFDAKNGRSIPEGFEPCEDLPDPNTGHWPGWLPVDPNNPADKFHMEAFIGDFEDGTYELVGPKINGNRQNLTSHVLWRHGSAIVENAPRTFEELRDWLMNNVCEGIVFHHEDGRMAKVRRKDFGIRW